MFADNQPTSATLIARLRNLNDETAWKRFTELYGPIVYRLGRSHKLDAEAADALVQDFYARAAASLPNFTYTPERGRFRKWVFTVALNEIRQAKRKESAYHRATDHFRDDVVRGQPQSDEELGEWWEAEETLQILHVATKRLREEVTPNRWAVFHLLTAEEMSLEEVASTYDLSKPQASVIKSRMLKRLREIVEEIEEHLETP